MIDALYRESVQRRCPKRPGLFKTGKMAIHRSLRRSCFPQPPPTPYPQPLPPTMLTPLSEGQKKNSHKISPTISSSSSTARTRTWRTCWPTRQWTARCRRAAILPPSCRHLAAMPPPHRPAPPGAPPTAHPPCGLHPPTHTLSTLCPAPPSRMRAPLPAQAMTRAERGTPKWACFAGADGACGGTRAGRPQRRVRRSEAC